MKKIARRRARAKKAASPSPLATVRPIRTPCAEAYRWVERLGRLLGVPVTNREEARALHNVCDIALSAVEAWGDGRMLLQALRTIRALRMMADAACEPAEVAQIGGTR